MFVELPASSPDPLDRLWRVSDATRTRKEAGVPEDADAAMQALVVRAAHGAEGRRARAREPARLQPRRLQHPRPADPDVPARLPAARGVSGRPAVGAPRALDRDDDDRRPTPASGSTPTRRRCRTPTCSRSTCTRRSTSCVPPWSHGRHHADPLRARRRGSRVRAPRYRRRRPRRPAGPGAGRDGARGHLQPLPVRDRVEQAPARGGRGLRRARRALPRHQRQRRGALPGRLARGDAALRRATRRGRTRTCTTRTSRWRARSAPR